MTPHLLQQKTKEHKHYSNLEAIAYKKAIKEDGYLYMDYKGNIVHDRVPSFNKGVVPDAYEFNQPTLKVVVQDKTWPHRALLFVGLPPEEENYNYFNSHSGETMLRYFFLMCFVQIYPRNCCTLGETKDDAVLNCHYINPKHGCLLTRIHNEKDMQRVPIKSNIVLEHMQLLMSNNSIKLAMRTHNKQILIDWNDLSKMLHIMQNNIDPADDPSRMAATLRVRCINVYPQKKSW